MMTHRLVPTIFAALLVIGSSGLRAEDYAITTFAGKTLTAGTEDGTPGTFNNPFGVAIDAAKNLYISDTTNQTIRKITPSRVVSTLAGAAGQPGFADGAGANARFNFPIGLGVDAAGNVYVADSRNCVIRKITPGGVVSSFAGAAGQFGSADGAAASARFFLPSGVAVDNTGNVYVADSGNHAIRRITPDGVVSTIAGAAQQPGSANGTGTAARFNSPWGITFAGNGVLYVSDSNNHTLRRVTTSGDVTTLAGQAGVSGAVDGTGTVARFNQPRGVAVDSGGNIFVADYGNNVVRLVTPAGAVSSPAGPIGQGPLTGAVDSVGSAARFFDLTDIAADGRTIYIVDSSNNLIRRGAPVSEASLPVISIQPIDQEVATGQSITFRVVASGASLGYQWQRNGTDITGATNSTYTIASPQTADSAVYSVHISSPGGSIDSQRGNLTVTPVGSGPIAITARPISQSIAVGESATFSVTASGADLRYQWQRNGANLSGATTSSFTISSAQTSDAGTYTVRITSGSAVETPSAKLIVGGTSTGGSTVTITSNPTAGAFEVGRSVTMSVTASGSNLTYQWYKDGVAISGATGSILSLSNVQVANSGSYFVRVSSGAVFQDSTATTLTVVSDNPGPPPGGPSARLSNLSVRTAMAAEQTLIVGMVVSGGPRDILVRAAGPALTGFGLSGAMADPRLELYNGQQLVFENNDWPSNLAATFASVSAFPFQSGSRDAAFVQSIDGARSIQVRGTGPGVVLVEAYDLGSGNTPRLVNVSARNRVGTGDDILIAGFNIAGTGTKRLLIRAVGPKLAAFGVTGVLNDPKLEVYTGAGVKLTENDNWDGALATTFSAVSAFALDANSRDAALLTTLDPGTYTVQVRGADGGTGEALIEIYEVP